MSVGRSVFADIFIIIVIAGIVIFICSSGEKKEAFDERQKIARRSAWGVSYLVLAAYTILTWWYCYYRLSNVTASGEMLGIVVALSSAGLAISFVIHEIICIFKDAFTPVGQRGRVVVFSSGFVIMGVQIVGLIIEGRTQGEWRLTLTLYCVICALFLRVTVAGLIKYLMDKRAEKQGGDE